MKGRPVDQIVYEYMFPKPKATDPPNFQGLLQRNLVPEVRQETHAFYGHLDTQEAKYPGLDYTHPIHRIRLSRFPWHRRLFRAFDGLRLTPAEIAGLTKWEGTKWAKDKYEREQGIVIRDTTADGFPNASDLEDPPYRARQSSTAPARNVADDLDGDESMHFEESDEEVESVGVELNARLRSQAARRNAGDTSAVLDEEWEQWLKNAIDSGELPYITEQVFRSSGENAPLTAAMFPPGLLGAARGGRWDEIPEFLHPMLRRTLQAETPSRVPVGRGVIARTQRIRTQIGSQAAVNLPAGEGRALWDDVQRIQIPWPRRTYSDLRLPVGDATHNQQIAEAPGA